MLVSGTNCRYFRDEMKMNLIPKITMGSLASYKNREWLRQESLL